MSEKQVGSLIHQRQTWLAQKREGRSQPEVPPPPGFGHLFQAAAQAAHLFARLRQGFDRIGEVVSNPSCSLNE
jgi:hypothetical protein